MHCHIKFHLALGMGLIIQTGKPHEMVKPPSNWPKCGHWAYPREDAERGNGGTGTDSEEETDDDSDKESKQPNDANVAWTASVVMATVLSVLSISAAK